MENNCTLGVSINTRYIGLALMNGSSLINYAVRLNKEKWSDTKAQKIITSLQSWFTHCNIQTIVLSSPHVHHQSKEMESLYQAIKKVFSEKSIAFRTYSIQEVFSGWGITSKKKKEALKEAISTLFPELEVLVEKDRLNKSVYYAKLFEAVGVAAFHLHSGKKM